MNKKAILAVLLFFFCSLGVPASAQRTAQDRIDEKEKQEAEALFSSDPDFNVTDVPEKWKGESAVILYQKMNYNYLNASWFKGGIDGKEVVRRRVKLQDKSAVDEFSTFYFLSSVSPYAWVQNEAHYLGYRIGIRVIKPSGKIIEVDVSKASVSEGAVPQIYRSLYTVNRNLVYKKVAVPGLEIGDIIDYYYISPLLDGAYYSSTRELAKRTYSFDPFLFTLAGTYPILKQKIEFKVDRNYYISFNSYNGAPSLQEGEAGTDSKGRVKEHVQTYSLVDEHREKMTKQMWTYGFLEVPFLKFQVAYSPKPSLASYMLNFIPGDPDTPRSKVSEEEIKKLILHRMNNKQLNTMVEKQYLGSILAYLKLFKHETDPEQIATRAYEYLRYQLGKSTFSFRDNDSRMGSYAFTTLMLKLCKKKKIPCEIFVAVPRFVATLDDVLLEYELLTGVRINGKLWLSSPSYFSTPDVINSNFQGAEVLVFPWAKKPELAAHTRVRIPVSEASQNKVRYRFTLQPDENLEYLSVTRDIGYTGNYKEEVTPHFIYWGDLYANETEKLALKKSREDRKREKEYAKSEPEKRKKFEEKRTERMKKSLEADFDLKEYEGVELLGYGRWKDDAEILRREKFTAENLLNKTGRNYSLNLGKFAGDHLALDADDRAERIYNIHIDYPRTILSEVEFLIPEGYEVEGLEEFNVAIDNPSMKLRSEARVEDGKIVLYVEKMYKNNFDKKETWDNYLRVLSAASDLTEKKVILRKKG